MRTACEKQVNMIKNLVIRIRNRLNSIRIVYLNNLKFWKLFNYLSTKLKNWFTIRLQISIQLQISTPKFENFLNSNNSYWVTYEFFKVSNICTPKRMRFKKLKIIISVKRIYFRFIEWLTLSIESRLCEKYEIIIIIARSKNVGHDLY